jgi:hypothetical protein
MYSLIEFFKKIAFTLSLVTLLAMDYSSSLELPLNIINGYKNYTQLEVGNLNILLSVPHDGYLRPDDINNRTNDALGNLLNDLNTRKIAQIIRDELMILFLVRNGINARPYIIYNNLHRYFICVNVLRK